MGDEVFYRSMRFMKKSVRGSKPVKVRLMKISDEFDGLCIEMIDHFLIKINKKLTTGHAIDVMLHEFAHVESWGKGIDPHGIIWGKCYSRLYRDYLNGFINSDATLKN